MMHASPKGPSTSADGRNSRTRKGKTMPDWGVEPTRGPQAHEDACISEEVKIGINIAIERFRLNEDKMELEFPTSLTATERAYIHRLAEDLGLKHKSKGRNASRYLVLSKKKEKTMGTKNAGLALAKNSKYQMNNLLQRFPLTNKERLELLSNMDAAQANEVSKEQARTATGRLNNGLPQVPPPRGRSDLINFTNSLPICQYRQLILDTINSNQICLVSGETGSGKTTQVPQMILDDSHINKTPCRIICTQPRRIAALSISERVAAERGELVGQTIGFQIRLESRVSPKTLLTYCTNGVLLRTLMGNERALDTVTHVIVDEVHERDKFCDFLLVSLRDCAKVNPNLKVILMSATLNIDHFIDYFGGCPAISVPGNLFPVEEFYLEDILAWTDYTSKKMEKYREHLAKEKEYLAKIDSWVDPRIDNRMRKREDDDIDKEPDDRVDLTEQLAMLGIEKEKEDLEPWLTKEMDKCMSDVWLTGDEELFSQIFYFIMSENVSVDYQHSETTVTPLMIAAGRGFHHIVEQLLAMEVDPHIKSSNGWTALDWARKFEQQNTVALLEAHMLALEGKTEEDDNLDDYTEMEEVSQEKKDALNIYQHCWDDDKVDVDLIAILVHQIVTTPPVLGAVLIFLPGYDDIVAMKNRIEEDKKFSKIRYTLFLLHSSMQSSDQKKVFWPTPSGVHKIILATNIAETSLTIDDVVYVIDSGKVKEKTYDAILQITTLKSTWISKASAAQRKGRAGRVKPGVCYHLFSSVRYQHMSHFATPELLRCPLQDLCLQTKLLAPSNESIEVFLSKAPDAPPPLVIRNALQILKQMDALDSNEELTEMGHHLADLPVDPHLGKMVLNAIILKCLDPILTIVCALAYKDPFLLPVQAYQKREVNQIRTDYSASTFSDHMILLRVFQAWQKARTDGWERGFCSQNYVSAAVMEMIVGMRAQLLGQLRASGFVRARGGGDIRDLNTNSENWAVVKAAMCSGAYPNLVHCDRYRLKFTSQTGDKIKAHPSSVIPQERKGVILPSEWMLYEEMTRSNSGLACVRCCTIVSPITVALFAGHTKLPPDAVKEINAGGPDGLEASDSENEEREYQKTHLLQLSDWLVFKLDEESAHLSLQLRQKWQCVFQRRMKAPSKPSSQMDEAVVSAVVNVLTNEEQALGFHQPAGIGQRPRPMSAESIMSGGTTAGHHQQSGGDYYTDTTRHLFSTSAKKATSTPPKRKDFMSPNLSHSSQSPGGSYSQHGSCTSSPLGSPNLGPNGDFPRPARYFIMKSKKLKRVENSMNKGAWATSKYTERKLNKAFQEGSTVYLIFLVPGTGHFQGYAIMSSLATEDRSFDQDHQGGVFSVDWVKRGNIQFQLTQSLLNPWNKNQPVQMCADGSEVEPTVGAMLLRLWDSFPESSDKHTGHDAWQRGEFHGRNRGYGGYSGRGRGGYHSQVSDYGGNNYGNQRYYHHHQHQQQQHRGYHHYHQQQPQMFYSRGSHGYLVFE